MQVIAAFLGNRRAAQTLRRAAPKGGPKVVSCRTLAALERVLDSRLVEALVLAPRRESWSDLDRLRSRFPAIPALAYARFRPDDGALLAACLTRAIPVVVEGVDDPIVGELVRRSSLTAKRLAALRDAPRLLRLTEPIQLDVWRTLVADVERPLGTDELAARFGMSREHLSRQVGAGGAPNLKRLMDLARIVCAAQLLHNPGYSIATVVRLLHFSSSSHLSRTARRVVGVPATGLGELGAGELVRRFMRGKTRSRV